MPPKTDVTRKAAEVNKYGFDSREYHIVYGTEKHRGDAFAWKAKGRSNVTEFRLLLVPPY